MASKSYLMCGAIGVLLLGAAAWYVAGGKTREAQANVPRLQEPPTLPDPEPQSPAAKHLPPLAAIPWKRDSVPFAQVFVEAAQLPWLRSIDESNASAVAASLQDGSGRVQLEPAFLPWNLERLASYAPVFLPTCQLPWHH